MNESDQPLLEVSETVPEATIQDRITDLALELVDSHGQDDKSGHLRTAVFYVADHEAGDGRYPSLKINIPKEEVSEKYAWRAELTFGNQDPSLSTHVLVRKDGTILASNYSDGEQRVFTEEQAEGFMAHLESVQQSFIQDQDI